MENPIILVKNAVKKFGSKKALNNVNLKIYSNNITILLGPNGAGKTTLLKAISGSLRLTSGTIIIQNINITENPFAAKKLTGFVPEENIGFPELTVRENLMFQARLHGLLREEANENTRRVVSLLGLEDYLDLEYGVLSKGYRRRVSIALALVHDPPILILDEPFSGLDPASSVILFKIIKNLADTGRTIVMATHNIGTALKLADYIYILGSGKIIDEGNPNKIRRVLGWR
jgi:ABC-type multidrug transport system ATPase subunit